MYENLGLMKRIGYRVLDVIWPLQVEVDIHRTAYERQVEYADSLRRNMITNGNVEPDYAHYLARKQAGLTE